MPQNQGSVGVMAEDGGDLRGWRHHGPKGARGVDLGVKWVEGSSLVSGLVFGLGGLWVIG